MDPVIVVGAGIAGVACAKELVDAGVEVRLVDRGKRIGGRMASRRLEGRPVDLGASYFTVSDDDFGALVESWRAAGLAHPWTDTFTVLSADEAPTAKSGPVRWGTPGGMRSLVEAMVADLAGVEVERERVRRVELAGPDHTELTVDGQPARAVALAMPDKQSARLLGPGLEAVRARADRAFDPVLCLTAAYPERTWDHVSPDGRFEAAFVNGDDAVDWIADDGRRRGDDAPVLVAHSGVELARRLLDRPGAAAPLMLASLGRLMGVGEPVDMSVQRWSLAKPTGERADPDELSLLGEELVGLCGDGWGPSSKVETAWLSGRDLGRRLAGRLAERPA